MAEDVPLWGTFAVDDHRRENAFAREVLLFDRLVIPVPADDVERRRWRSPRAGEDWDPDRQERLLALLGHQHAAGVDGARLAWTMPWTEDTWRRASSRLQVASTITALDAFQTTRWYLASGEPLP